MTLRSRLTQLFLGAVQVTFLCAVVAYWGLQSWRLVNDDLTAVLQQTERLSIVLYRLAGGADSAFDRDSIVEAVDVLRRNAQTLDESEPVEALATVAGRGEPAQIRSAVTAVADHYRAEHQRLRARSEFLARASRVLVAAIVLLVIASFVIFLAAVRAWLVEPIRQLERGTQIMSTGDLTHRIALGGGDELARLAGSVNHMAASLAHIQEEMVTRERFALLGELAAYVAHNIRNPLASIHASAQAEALDLAANDPRRGPLEDIVKAAERLSAWVEDLLRSASPIRLERRPSSVSALVNRCAEMIRPRLLTAGVSLDLVVDPTPAVSVDEAKLEQVVSAVLANATDTSPRGGHIAVRVEQDASALIVRVADQGKGIPAAQRDQLFRPFATTKVWGTGLGLWLSQKIVTAHGGTITLHNGSPGGTTVEIRLPLTEEGECQAS